MSFRLLQWLRVSFFSLLLVALIGCILRYKIAFSLPFIDQKHLLHAHSHFAFSGWVSQALMAFLIDYASRKKGVDLFSKYCWLLWINIITAYGMLFSFPFQGYGFFSISFSTLSILNSWFFALLFWLELNGITKQTIVEKWFKASLFFNAFSAFGAFGLSVMMANKIVHQNWYLLAVYFFLHFQYNGWFFFACMGFLFEKILKIAPHFKNQALIFWLFAGACLPAYFLSALWLPMPNWVYGLVTASAIIQIIAWIILSKQISPLAKQFSSFHSKPANLILLFSAVALTIKLLLQALSTIPAISKLAFGFRPIVIAYLHLILLGFITLFLIANFLSSELIKRNKLIIIGVYIFVFGIIFNECLLMIQGIASIFEFSISNINEFLLLAAAVLFSGILLLNLGINKRS